MIADYLQRSVRYGSIGTERFSSEDKFLAWAEQLRAKGRTLAILFDSTGELLSSEDLSTLIADSGTQGTQHLIFAIGPADGWSKAARSTAKRLIAFGRITLPHELALAIAAEQIYRALTIQSGHPYHSGH